MLLCDLHKMRPALVHPYWHWWDVCGHRKRQKEGARQWQMGDGGRGKAEVDEDREEGEGGRKRTHIPTQSLSFPLSLLGT